MKPDPNILKNLQNFEQKIYEWFLEVLNEKDKTESKVRKE